MNNSKTILTQSSKMMIFWAVGVAISYFSTIVFTNYLSQTTFGDFTLARTVINLLAIFCAFGLNQGLLRQGSIALGKGKNDIFEQIRNYTISLTTVIGLFCCLIVFIMAEPIAVYVFKNPGISTEIRFFSFVIPVQILNNMILTLFQVNKRADIGQFLNLIVYFALQLALFLLCTRFFEDQTLIISSFLASNFIYLLVLLYYQKKSGYRFSFNLNKIEKREIFRVSFPMFLANIFNQSQKWGDTILLGILSTSSNVGIYYIGLRIAAFVSIPANAINKIFTPIAGRLIGEENQAELNDLYKLVTRVIFIFGSLIFGCIFFMKAFLLSFFGAGYESAAAVILVILISEAVDFSVGAAGQLITMSGGGRLNTINAAITITINVVSSVLLIPRYGIMGAAISNALTNITKQMLGVFELIFIFKLSPFNKKYFLIIAIFIACITAVNYLPFDDIFKLISFVSIIVPLYLLFAINSSEKVRIKKMLKGKKKGKATE